MSRKPALVSRGCGSSRWATRSRTGISATPVLPPDHFPIIGRELGLTYSHIAHHDLSQIPLGVRAVANVHRRILVYR